MPDAAVLGARIARRRRRAARAARSTRPTRRSSTTRRRCSDADRGDQLARRAERDDLAVVHDRHAVAQPLGLVHVVRGQQDRPAGLLELLDEIPELPPRLRIEAGGRLVEKEQLGIADERAGERQPLLLPARERADARRRASPRAARARSPRPAPGPDRRSCGTGAASRRTVSLSESCVSCSWMPSRWRSAGASDAQRSPSTSTSPASGSVSPSQISIVVVLPAPFGPSRPKHSPGRHLEVEAVDGDDVLVGLAQIGDAQGGARLGRGHPVELAFDGYGHHDEHDGRWTR